MEKCEREIEEDFQEGDRGRDLLERIKADYPAGKRLRWS